MTSSFFKTLPSQLVLPALETYIIKLERQYEEYLHREILFVRQCYMSGRRIWWRKFFHLGQSIPEEHVIREWILNNTRPSVWMCLNPKIMPMAIKHFYRRIFQLQLDIAYYKELRTVCHLNNEIQMKNTDMIKLKLK